MKTLSCLLCLAALAGCAGERYNPEREWQRAECDRIIDREARERCLRRLDDDYGGSPRSEPEAKPRK